ncbi:MAG TPA: carboxypeptidase-like regulatory domain-containing protein, partial [Gemmatimonadaceae bacterium]|nr:carboxypeptidase-like regulatory domain-containing protein [Gemmatimonadaceae bacterium]
MIRLLPLLLAASVLIAEEAHGQLSPVPVKDPPWADTTNESPIYPVGDAIPVYRAVLDLIYLDGSKRPSVIIMLDTAEGRMGGPCAFAKCLGDAWKHKSKMDTVTVLAFARFSRKRPGMRPFGYPIPIVFISHDDVRRMDADGHEVIALHPMPNDLPKRSWGFWAELQRKYPGAWGATTLSKVGFNKRHTEALVQSHHWCGDDCRVHETLFLRQTKGRWRVVERIPEQVDAGSSPYGRYLGPIGTTPKESEIIPVDRPGVPFEATARADVYRIVVDSLYSVNGERPKRIVLTNWFWSPGQIPADSGKRDAGGGKRTTGVIDPTVVKRFSVLGTLRAPFDAISGYRAAISTLPVDSVPVLRERGTALDVEQTGFPFWIAFARKYPGAWGMLGVSRIAFNANRSQALVNTYHACGNSCTSRDTWFLTRSGKSWQIVERIPAENQNYVEVEPLRYVGADVSPSAYRPRRVQGVVTDAETGAPVPALNIRVRRSLNSGLNIDEPPLRTDSLGRFSLTRLPLNAPIVLTFL